MTDQPSTQEGCTRFVHWFSYGPVCRCGKTRYQNVEEGNAPAAGDGTPGRQATPSNDPAKRASSTTQEAEKALEELDKAFAQASGQTSDAGLREVEKRFDAALRSLRTQHTKDQERIEKLERVLANLGVQLTAGGSGDPAGGEVE